MLIRERLLASLDHVLNKLVPSHFTYACNPISHPDNALLAEERKTHLSQYNETLLGISAACMLFLIYLSIAELLDKLSTRTHDDHQAIHRELRTLLTAERESKTTIDHLGELT